ncbi:hypothetical protein ATCC90586_003639 [Pythium insidiosum]|nr:hypothetical protein ATCC90586_003639 [Pythium insidiosum]
MLTNFPERAHPLNSGRWRWQSFGMTAVHWAAYGGHLACVQALLNAGASVAIVDQNGRNALHHACRKDHEEVVRYLLTSVKMDVNSLTEGRDTPLHKAVMGKSVKCIEVLLHHGADPQLRNDQNRTPLDELDAIRSGVRDEMPEPISTARIEEELAAWRHQFLTEVSAQQPPRRGSTGASTSASHGLSRLQTLRRRRSVESDPDRFSSAPTSAFRGVENTLVTSFRSRLSEYSERMSSNADPSASSRPSSSSSGGLGRPVVVPLNLQSVGAIASASAGSNTASDSVITSSSRSSTTRSFAERLQHHREASIQRKKSLKYAGKRVIMMLRVKKHLSGDEKCEMIRLLLMRHLKGEPSPDAVQTIGGAVSPRATSPGSVGSHGLQRAPSDFTLSVPPNF